MSLFSCFVFVVVFVVFSFFASPLIKFVFGCGDLSFSELSILFLCVFVAVSVVLCLWVLVSVVSSGSLGKVECGQWIRLF